MTPDQTSTKIKNPSANSKSQTKNNPKKIKIFAAGDLHGNISLAKKLADQANAEGVDLVILNGDIVEENNPQGIVGLFKAKDRRVFMIPGNHESEATTEFLTKMYGETNLHGYSVRMGKIGFFGCGGANMGFNQLSEDEIFETLKKGFNYVKDLPIKIMVTHNHPSESIMEKFSQFVLGSTGVKKAIDVLQPDVLICGHVHEAAGIEEMIGKTKVVNVGTKGKIFNFDS